MFLAACVLPGVRALVFIDPPYELCFADNLNFRLPGSRARATCSGVGVGGVMGNPSQGRVLYAGSGATHTKAGRQFGFDAP